MQIKTNPKKINLLNRLVLIAPNPRSVLCISTQISPSDRALPRVAIFLPVGITVYYKFCINSV